MVVLIAGAGIGGLSLGLTLHQIGVPFKIFEQAKEIKPMGVGINLQPNCVKELFDLGLQKQLAALGVETKEFSMFSKHGLEIWSEPRGKLAGYNWPQYSVHRGDFQMLLYKTLVERAGTNCVETGWRATGFENSKNGAKLQLKSNETSHTRTEQGEIVIGADGIHSALRAQMVPDEGAPIWGGAILWRATSMGKPYRTGATIVMIGHDTQRIVAYPISKPDPKTGLVVINWIAELRVDPDKGWNKEDWNREADRNDFAPLFKEWNFDWFNSPKIIQDAEKVFEYPMVDRDPPEHLARWFRYPAWRCRARHLPRGVKWCEPSHNGRAKIRAGFFNHGVGVNALKTYEDEVRPATTKLGLANRGSGPDAVLQMIEDRCGGKFDKLEDVASHEELSSHASAYKKIAGFAIETLNKSEQTIPDGAKVKL